MAAARDEARRHNQHIEPSHLLLEILRSPDCGACRLIRRKLASIDSLTPKVLSLVLSAEVQPEIVPRKPPISRRAKSAIEHSVDLVFAQRRAWNSIDILRGILREGTSPAAKLLNDVGVTIEFLETELETEGLSFFFDEENATESV